MSQQASGQGGAGPVLRFDPRAPDGLYVDLERLVSSRLLVQGSSGAGKSFLIRYLLEQTHGRIQQFVFDPEGEFSTLRERFDYVVASAGGDGDVPAHPDSADLLCRQLVELEASAILDIYELDPEEREEFVGRFLHRLVNMPKESWRSALVVVDEAHEFAPEQGKPPSRKPMELIVSKGRKRGLCAIYSTQRLSKLSKNASDLQNVLVGYTGLDVDVRRAGDILGFDKAQGLELKRLEHEFFAFGPAFSREVIRVRSGPVQTHHPKPGEIRAPTPPPRGRLAELVAELAAIPDRAAEEEATLEGLQERVRELEAQLRAERARVGVTKEVAETMAEQRARAAVAALRTEVRPHVESLYHALANGSQPGLAPGKAEPPRAPAVSASPAPRRRTVPAPAVARAARRHVERPADGVQIGGTPRRMIDAMAALYGLGVVEPSREVVAGWLGISARTGSFSNNLSELRTAELIEDRPGKAVALTELGHAEAEPPSSLPTLRELHETWKAKLGGTTARMLEVIIEAYPNPVEREAIGAALGISHTTGSFSNNLSALRKPGLIRDVSRGGPVVATELLFPEGLR